MSNWYITKEGKQYGPYDWNQLLQLKGDNYLNKNDLVWSEKLNNWTPASQIKDLFVNQENISNANNVSGLSVRSNNNINNSKKELKGLKYQILGSVMPMVEIMLDKDERLYAQSGAMQWMDQNIKMDTEMKGGVFGAFKRKMSGEDMFVQYFTGLDDGAIVAFGHTYPGNILPLDISKGTVICQRRSFLCAYESVDYDIHIQRRLGSGFFGGEGFIMQKLSGQGLAFIEIDGECIVKDLAQGEKIRVETGSVGAFEEGVSFSIERVKGIKNMFLGGEGMFLTTLEGPGKVWLQTMPIQSMAGELYHYLPLSNN
ncbi:TIGR00266 family protein [Natranaerofaba carboxydovora]|uniref:TIGR00266 family protein n=1 Tax=Natranaerofaba carboxydovora TaxID=2742683 RepID=UPI001F142F31|nr:TIGR00266 family protein [Natranaerofaba carboxydovora]UMZ73665.1 Mitochondrial biogenesis AIM24 [Natranaerofaba carboxydovora]